MLAKTQSPLSRKAVLVTMPISQWTARRLDRKVTDEVNRSHGAAEDAGRYNKLLIEKRRLEAVQKAVTGLRTLYYKYTKPWHDEGSRVLPNTLFTKFMEEWRTGLAAFDEAADAFCRDYDLFVRERKVALNGLFSEQDYPPSSEIRSKFKATVNVMPFPDAADFRADLDDTIVADIKAEIEASSREAATKIQTHTMEQIADVVRAMAERLKAYGEKKDGDRTGYFRDSLVENVRELVELLPAFNMEGDPVLNTLCERMQRELCVESAQELRDNPAARESVQKSAEDILADVSRFMS
jgi:hypothetical protein